MTTEIKKFNPDTGQITLEVVLPVEAFDYVKTQSALQKRNFSGMLFVMIRHYEETPSNRLANEIEAGQKGKCAVCGAMTYKLRDMSTGEPIQVCTECEKLTTEHIESLATIARLKKLTKHGRVELEYSPSDNGWHSAYGKLGDIQPKYFGPYPTMHAAINAISSEP